jgi:leucyl aminopeptidase
MNFEIKTLSLAQIASEKADALVVLVPKDYKGGTGPLAVELARAIKDGDLDTGAGKAMSLFRSEWATAKRMVWVGAGQGSAKEVYKAVAAAMAAFKSCERVLVALTALPEVGAAQLHAAALAAASASYAYTTTKPGASSRKLKTVQLATAKPVADVLAKDLDATVAGIELAKEWGNRPANHATPTDLANAAKALAKLPKTSVQVLGPKEVAKLGMGSFMAVAQGSEEPLRFIVLKYQGAAASQAPTVLVGKGITFDTGGISIKPAAEMDEMKFDMCGAASVLGVFRALGEMKPKVNVVGLIPTCENMPSGRAIKPGDVVTSMSGQTIEILNTDAEGRLILCDALTYAERFKPRAVIDIATLTGACVIALGHIRSGLFASDDELAQALSRAGDEALDPCWRMPLDAEYADGLKSNFANLANIAGRAGGAVTAAKFLQSFTSKFAWAHLDIAGTAWKTGTAKGATGRPVGLLLHYLCGLQEGAATASKTARKTKTAARKA